VSADLAAVPEPPARPTPSAVPAAPRRPARLLALLLLAALVAELARGAWHALPRAAAWLAAASRHWDEDYPASRRRLFGEYARGLEAVEQLVPRSGYYLLINVPPGGGHVILQGDLAPRRAFHDGEEARGLPRQWRRRGVPAHAPWALVHFQGLDRAATVGPLREHPEAWPRPEEP
jgi:hypothetical protein